VLATQGYQESFTAHLAVAGKHLGIAEKCNAWWQQPLAIWHQKLSRDAAARAILVPGVIRLRAQELKTLTQATATSISQFKGDREAIVVLLRFGLFQEPDPEMTLITRASLLITLRDIEMSLDREMDACETNEKVFQLVYGLRANESDDHASELVRLMAEAAFFKRRNTTINRLDRFRIAWLMDRCLTLALQVDGELAAKIRRECNKLSIWVVR
jgi:hypothetical protein